jgi:hypothetical protein
MQKVTEEELITYLGKFREFAEEHSEKEFLLTAIGTGIAGFDTNYMAYMILRANLPDNVTLPKEFTKIKGYKGFNPDMTCRGFKYEEGKDYEEEGEIGACENGFHFCLHPLDVFGYYPPAYIGMNKFHEVEGSGYMDADEDDTKIACSKIHIGAKLDIKGLVKATVSYVKERCTNRNNANPGFPATAGNYGAATAGDSGAATAGNYGAATAGDSGAATAGYRGAATAGNYGAATAGDRGAATSRGSSSTGNNGLAVARGTNVKVRGGMGSILVIAEEQESSYDVSDWKAVVVDGKNIKADTWYILVDGEFVEVED